MKKVLIAGGTGFIGRSLAEALELEGYDVSILTRKTHPDMKYHAITWNPESLYIAEHDLSQYSIIINLSGASIAGGLWTRNRKQEILESRIFTTRTLVKNLVNYKLKPSIFINASAVGYYGDRPGEILTEASEKGAGFLSDVCSLWEKETEPLITFDIHCAILRFGMVLEGSDGIFPNLYKSLKYGVDLRFGKGEQYFSWIHLNDLNRIIIALADNKLKEGIYNCTTPNPFKQRAFNKEVLSLIGKKGIGISIPKKLVNLILGEFSTLLTNDNFVMPQHLIKQQFNYTYPTLTSALKQILHA